MGLCYDPAAQVTNILHQLTATNTQINKAEYLYNPVGNRTSLTDKRGSQAFGYDNLDRLTSASHPLLGTPQAFAYDAVGNRTTAGNVTNAGNQLTADATHSYQYDGEDILLEYDGTNTLQARYTHGLGIDEPIAVTKGSNTFFYHQGIKERM